MRTKFFHKVERRTKCVTNMLGVGRLETHKSFPIVIVWENGPFSVGIVIERVVETHKCTPVVTVWKSARFSVGIIIEQIVEMLKSMPVVNV